MRNMHWRMLPRSSRFLLGLGMDEASTLIVAGTTAMLMLRDVARLQPGESIFIPGAAGGVGGYLIQIAKLLGGRDDHWRCWHRC